MKPYIKTYLDYFGITPDVDPVYCEVSRKMAKDIHHIHLKGMGGRKTFRYKGKTYDIDDITNLIALSMDNHIKAHKGELSKDYLMVLHKIYMKKHGI